MATIGDVAREAGVARSTVSAVLTGRKVVLPETRARVEAAIARLNYSVNSGARALATRRTMTLGLLVSFQGAAVSPALITYLVAITDAARAHGYGVLLLTQPDGATAIREVVAAGQVDGLVLLNVVEQDDRIVAATAAGCPTVLVGRPEDTGGVDAVDLDFGAAARLLVAHLRTAGHLAATLLTFSEEVFRAGRTYAHRFRAAALAEAAARGLTLDVRSCPEEPGQVRDSLRDLLTSRSDGRALLVHNDAAVAMLPLVLHELGRAVPRDLSVVSLHSAELGRLYALPYTAVESEPGRVCRLAVEMLVRRLDGDEDGGAVATLVAPQLVDRGSVGPGPS